MCYSCGNKQWTASATAAKQYNPPEFIKFKCSVLKNNLSKLFSLLGASNEFSTAIGEKVYTVNSVTFFTAKLIPTVDNVFIGDLIFKIAASDRCVDFSQIFSFVEE